MVLERRGTRLPGIPFLGRGDDQGAPNAAVFSSLATQAAELGAGQVAVRDHAAGLAPPEVVPHMVAGVVSSREAPYRRLEVELDNGQV